MSDALRGLRAEFAACGRGTYLDVAGRAPMADRVAAALDETIAVSRYEGARKEEWLAAVERVRADLARFLGVSAGEVAFTRNTSDGLNTIAHGLGLAAGENVVICPALEHPNNVYAWMHLRERGVEVRFAPAGAGGYDVDAITSLCDARTRLVTVSAVSFVLGCRADLASLAALCRPRDIFLLVDGAQALGIVDVPVGPTGADAVAAGAQKGLLAIYGLGVLCCRHDWIPRLRPTFLSRNGVDNRTAHESALADPERYEIHEDARRFEVGNPNFMGVFALGSALGILHEAGLPRIEAHVLQLSGALADGLSEAGYRVVTPRPALARAGIVSFEHADAEGLVARLRAGGVRVSARRGDVRASLHLYNDPGDVDALLAALGEA